MTVEVKVRSKNNRLQLRYVYPKGKREEISLGLSDTPTNRRIAEGKAAQIELDIVNGHYDLSVEKYRKFHPKYRSAGILPSQNNKFPDLEILWKQYTEFRRGQVAESTYLVDYQKITQRIKLIKARKLEDPIAIRNWLKIEKKYSPETIRRTIQQLSACCQWACRSNSIEENPFKSIRNEIQPKRNTKGKSNQPFLKEEVKAIIEAFKNDTYCSKNSTVKHSFYLDYVIWMFNTGMRPEEVVILKYKDITNKYIYINKAYRVDCKIEKDTKNHKPRKIQLNAHLKEIVKRRKKLIYSPEDLFFPSPSGKIINYNNFCRRSWKQVIEGLVKDGKVREYLSAYHAKHTFISMCLEKGYNPKNIENLVGVSAKVILSNYAGILNELPPPSYF